MPFISHNGSISKLYSRYPQSVQTRMLAITLVVQDTLCPASGWPLNSDSVSWRMNLATRVPVSNNVRMNSASNMMTK